MESQNDNVEDLKETRIRNSLRQLTKAQLVDKVREMQKRNDFLEKDNAEMHTKLKDYLDRESAYWKKEDDGSIRCSKCHRKAPKDKTIFWGESYHPTRFCMHCGSVMREAK